MSETPAQDAYAAHLTGCNDCNYDRDCIACAGGDGGHGCNCHERDGGAGVKLRNTAEAERQAALPAKTDGLGNPIDPAGAYFVQDSRSCVGNCGSWWAPDSAGYCCDINAAGIYLGAAVRGMRGTDIPWPVNYVRANTVSHVRVDVPAFSRRNYKPGPRS